MLYVPARNHGPAANFPIKRIVVHGTVSPCVPGGALSIAKMFAHTTRPASTQKVHDPTTSIRCVPDNVIAYGAPPNAGSLHHELCDPQKGSTARWSDPNHLAMLHRAAADVAADCKKYGIPIVKLNATDLRAGRKGICGHADISAAWHQTDHTDPGVGFPWRLFLALVNQYAHPAPIPRPHPATNGADMFAVKIKTESAEWVSTGTERRWIPNIAARDALVAAHAISGSPLLVDDAAELDAVAGPVKDGTPVPPVA